MSGLDQENICSYTARINSLETAKKDKSQYVHFLEVQISQIMKKRNWCERNFPTYLFFGLSSNCNTISKHQKTIKETLMSVEEIDSEISRIKKLRIKYAKRTLGEMDISNQKLFEAHSSLKDITEIVMLYVSEIDSIHKSINKVRDSFFSDSRDLNFTLTKLSEIELASNVESLYSNAKLLVSTIKKHNENYPCYTVSVSFDNIIFKQDVIKEVRTSYLFSKEELDWIDSYFANTKSAFEAYVKKVVFVAKGAIDERVDTLVTNFIADTQK